MARNFYKKYLIIIAIVAVIILLNSFLFGNFLQNALHKIIVKPGIYVSKNLPFLSKLSAGFFKTRELNDENSRIKEENNLLRGELAQLENLKRENQFLRDQLGVARRVAADLMIAEIFNIQSSATSSTALINRGSGDGVKKGMPLIAAGNIMVGNVDQVFENSSLVMLLDDPRIKISGRGQESNILVDVVGRLHNELALNLAAAGDEIKEGDTVVTSGLDGLPESLLVAKVIKVETPSGALFKTVTAHPFFDPSLGSSLFVILK